jgi:hypothetical protein
LECFKEAIAKFFGNYKDPNYKKIVEKNVRKVYSVRLCHELKSAFPKFSSGLLSGKSWSCYCGARRKVSSRHKGDGNTTPGKMEC